MSRLMSRPTTYTLREARDHSGLSREQVATQLGFSSKTLERMELANRGKRYIVAQLAELYGVPLRRVRFKAQPARTTGELVA